MVRITKQLVSNGSYGIYQVNPSTGQPRSGVMLVWHLAVDGKRIGTYPTRRDAREAAVNAEVERGEHTP